jgi:hypothetical protein
MRGEYRVDLSALRRADVEYALLTQYLNRCADPAACVHGGSLQLAVQHAIAAPVRQ